MAAPIGEFCLLAFSIGKCKHGPAKNSIKAVSYSAKMSDICFEPDLHGPAENIEIEASCSVRKVNVYNSDTGAIDLN